MTGATHYGTHEERVEQAVAYGRSVEWMRRNLDATPADIADARTRIAEAVEGDAWVQTERALADVPRRPGRPATAPCGTVAAYKRHLRHGERACEACRRANVRDVQDRHVKRHSAGVTG